MGARLKTRWAAATLAAIAVASAGFAATGVPSASAPAATPLPAAARVPVLLVPGWSNGAADMLPLRERFLAAGWDSASVVAVGFEDPVGGNRAHARELARAVDALRAATRAEEIDVVAHSMGGLALRHYLWSGGAVAVRRVVFLATPQRGTVTSFLAWGEGADQMRPGSAFLLSIMRVSPLPPEVRGLTVHTPLDLHVLPHETTTLPGVPHVEVCCPTHEGLLDDAETFAAVRRFLGGA